MSGMKAKAIFTVCYRELLLVARQFSDSLQALILHLVLMCLLAFILEAHPAARTQVSPLLIWFSIIVSTSLSADQLFREDFLDGSLEQWILSGRSLLGLIWSKAAVFWALTVLPILLTLPLMQPILSYPANSLWTLGISIFLASPVLVWLLALMTVVSLPLTSRALIVNCLIWPLILPLILLSIGSVESEINLISFLLAVLLLSVTFIPWMIRYLLLISLE